MGGCGSNLAHAKKNGEGFAPLAARPRRSKAHFASPSDYRGYALMPAPPLPTHLLRIRMGALNKPTGLFSLRPSLLFPYSSCANRSLYFGLCPRASRLRDASASGHPLLVADARASTLESLSSFGKRERGSRLFACSPVPVGGRRGMIFAAQGQRHSPLV